MTDDKNIEIIEYTPNDYTIISTETISNYTYRIIRYSTNYYALQVKYDDNHLTHTEEDDSYYHTLVISTSPYITNGTIGSIIGEGDLQNIITAYKNQDLLEKGEYWNLELTIYVNGKKGEKIKETILREEGERLIDRIDESRRIIEEANLYQDNTSNIEETITSIILTIFFIIIIALILHKILP